MLQILNPKYTLRIEITDLLPSPQALGLQGGVILARGSGAQDQAPSGRRFHNDTGFVSKTGCDEVLAAVKEALQKAGLGNALVTLERFERAA